MFYNIIYYYFVLLHFLAFPNKLLTFDVTYYKNLTI